MKMACVIVSAAGQLIQRMFRATGPPEFWHRLRFAKPAPLRLLQNQFEIQEM